MAQIIEHLPNKCETLSSNFSSAKTKNKAKQKKWKGLFWLTVWKFYFQTVTIALACSVALACEVVCNGGKHMVQQLFSL
jgi:hypothetical protein